MRQWAKAHMSRWPALPSGSERLLLSWRPLKTTVLVAALLSSCLSTACSADPGVGPSEPQPGATADAVLEVLPAPPTTARAAPTVAAPPPEHPGLRNPGKARERAPEGFSVRFETTAGTLDFECVRKHAPIGVDRFYNLVKIGFFRDIAFFRVVKEPKPFVIQFGIHGDPSVSAQWRDANLSADPQTRPNTRGTLTFAQAGNPDTRTTQLFINLTDNSFLDKMGFAPVCDVMGDGMATLDRVNGRYGDAPTSQQSRMQRDGNSFLRSEFPDLDYIQSGTLLGP